MNCAFHADAQNVAFCIRCGRALCGECVRSVRGSVYCENCLGEFVEQKPPNPASGERTIDSVGGANPGAAFALGLIPGVGAIYNAEFIKAAVHLVIFGMLIGIAGDVGGPLEPLFALLVFGFYVYMPFEAYYTAKKRKLSREGVALETPFDRLSEQFGNIKDREWWSGVTMIAIGTLFLLNNFSIVRLAEIFRLWPIILIVIGVWLLKRFQDKAV